jgi:DNA topoisomerase I
MKLLIVESPGKIKKLKSILGSGWRIEASFGHITQLSNEGADKLGFEMNGDKIACNYIPRSDRAKATIAKLKAAAKEAEEVVLASDPDREGETIAWHLAEVLRLKNPKRVVYQSITAAAVDKAIKNPRRIDSHLVAAGRCRDCLDKLVGYKGSPLVWRLNNGAKSVGRVQSATLHLVCQREREILNFRPQDYWSVFVDYAEGFRAFYYGASATTETEETPDDAGTEIKAPESTKVLSQVEADRLVAIARSSAHQATEIEAKQTTKTSPPPFTTSTLQQTAGAKLKFSPDQTMALAQKLYEAGLISYMRTDSVELSAECISQGREWLSAKDPQNLPAKPPKATANKNSQEGHEAIRPTNFFKSSQELKTEISDNEFALYLLIWKRTIAFLCKPALLNKATIITTAGETRWRARGQVVAFPGYLRYWQNLSADNELPIVTQGQTLTCQKATAEAKQTQPPARYTEAQLVQAMEKKGVGRPSTYAPTVATLKERSYVELDPKKRLNPTQVGMEVDDYLGTALPDLLAPEFTAQMERSLDEIAAGKLDWEKYLTGWNHSYLIPALAKAGGGSYRGNGQEPVRSDRPCPECLQPLAQIPFAKSVKGHFLKCDKGCLSEDGRGLVLFWNDRQQQWERPRQPSEIQRSDIPCPKCQQPMEKLASPKVSSGFYLKCSKCKDAVMFWDDRQNQWQSPTPKSPEPKTPKRTKKSKKN